MSSWTYVRGLIEAETFAQSDAEAIFKSQTIVDHLPRITGSEGPASIVVVPKPGWHNNSGFTDELGHFSNLGKGRHGSFPVKSTVLLVLHGNLRDRWFSQTLYEVTKCLARLSSRLYVRDCLVCVSGFDQQFILIALTGSVKCLTADGDRKLVNWGAIPKSNMNDVSELDEGE